MRLPQMFRSNRLLPHAAIVVAGFLTLTTLATLRVFGREFRVCLHQLRPDVQLPDLLTAFLDQVVSNGTFGFLLTLLLMALGAFRLSLIQSDESATRFSLGVLTATGGICTFVTFAVILMFFKGLLGGVLTGVYTKDGRLPFSETYFAADVPPVSLPAALASHGRAGYAPLSEGYRGELRPVARTGTFARFEHGREPETLEFNKVNYDNRGVGSLSKPAFAIIVAGPTSFHHPAIHLKEIPSVDRLKELRRVADFERIFGEFRGQPDGWGGDGGIHVSGGWTGFTLQPDGSARVVSVFLQTFYRERKVEEFEGAEISEGIFKPTGKTPQFPNPGPTSSGNGQYVDNSYVPGADAEWTVKIDANSDGDRIILINAGTTSITSLAEAVQALREFASETHGLRVVVDADGQAGVAALLKVTDALAELPDVQIHLGDRYLLKPEENASIRK